MRQPHSHCLGLKLLYSYADLFRHVSIGLFWRLSLFTGIPPWWWMLVSRKNRCWKRKRKSRLWWIMTLVVSAKLQNNKEIWQRKVIFSIKLRICINKNGVFSFYHSFYAFMKTWSWRQFNISDMCIRKSKWKTPTFKRLTKALESNREWKFRGISVYEKSNGISNDECNVMSKQNQMALL